MIYKTVELKDLYPVKGGRLQVVCMKNPWDVGHDDWRRPAVVIVPGGGYEFVSRREGIPAANEFLSRGYQVFVLEYLCSRQEVAYPEQLVEISCAIDYVRKNAESFFVNPEEIFAVGFSAGGHLVADLSNEYASVSEKAGVKLDCKPTAAGLSYPVIDEHDDSFDNLLYGYDGDAAEKMKKRLKLIGLVSKKTVPTFIWATAEDNYVPVGNSLRYALALSKKKVPFEAHIYPKGWHGLSSGAADINYFDDTTDPTVKLVHGWVDECARFFRSFCKEKI